MLSGDQISDRRFKEFVINYMVPFPVILAQAGYDGYDYQGKVFCVFHDNSDSPAAKLYKSDRGDTLWCFAEQKRYYPVDVIKKGLLEKSVEVIFSRLWASLEESDKDAIITLYQKPVDILSDTWKKNEHILAMFKEGRVSLDQHIKNIVICLE